MRGIANRSAAGRKAAEARHRRTKALRNTCSRRMSDGSRCGAPSRGRICKEHHAEYMREVWRPRQKARLRPLKKRGRRAEGFGPRGLKNLREALKDL